MSGVLGSLLHHRRREFGLATVGFCLDVAFHRTWLHRIEAGIGPQMGQTAGMAG